MAILNFPLAPTLGQWLASATEALEKAGVFLGHGTDNYWDEALHLTLPTLDIGFDAGRDVLAQVLSAEQLNALQHLLQRRIEQRVPVPYLTGRAWFALLPFYVSSAVLIPRSPIAELVERGFRPWVLCEPRRVLDLCCGGGCIGIASACYLPQAQVDLTDLSDEALVVAQQNVDDYGLADRVRCYRGDLFAAVPEGTTYDVIVSNPPYVDRADMNSLPPEYLHEPQSALVAGEDGLDLVRVILAQAAHYLNADGVLLVEVGNSQQALEAAFPHIPFVWLEFERGGHGVFVLTREQLEAAFPV